MKYLIFLLITVNVFAEMRVNITNNISGKEFGAKFKTQELADEWIAGRISNESWGKKERWERFYLQSECLEVRDVLDELDEVMFQECKMPVQYTIVQTDITVEENIKKDKLAACNLLSDLLKIQDLKLDELNKLAKCRGW